MATVSVDINNADVPEVLAAVEEQYRSHAINLFFSGNPATYDALSAQNKGKALLAAFLRVTTRNYRRRLAQEAVNTSDPDVS